MSGEQPANDAAPVPAPERRSGSQTRKRHRRVVVPLTPDELEQVQRLASNQGHSPGALARHALLGLPLPRRRRSALLDLAEVAALRAELGNLRAELGKIGSNVNQIAHQLNAKEGVIPAYLEDMIAKLDEILSTFPELRDQIMRALGAEHFDMDDED